MSFNPYHGVHAAGTTPSRRSRIWRKSSNSRARPHRGIHPRAVIGTNGMLVPPDGFLAGVRALCDKYGILMICDEVMSGFGRTGEWFAVDHWNVVPDLMTMAKGLTSAYVPLGAVGLRRKIADHFADKVFPSGLTYNSHPLGCAAALATLGVYEEDDLIAARRERGVLMRSLLEDLAAKHPSVGASGPSASSASWNSCAISKTVPLAPFDGDLTGDGRTQVLPRRRTLHVRPLEHFFTNPPLSITEDELREGFAIIDRALAITDAAVS